jgi:hypothetical protein
MMVAGRPSIALIPEDFSVDWVGWMIESGSGILKLYMLQKNDNLLPFLASGRGPEVLRRARAAGIGSITSSGCFLDANYVALHGEPPLHEYVDVLTSVGRQAE